MANCPSAPPPKKAPKAKDLAIGAAPPLPPTDAVRAKLVCDTELLMAIDVETNALVPTKKSSPSWWRPGRFGFLTTLDDDDLAQMRVVQIGWTIGKRGDDAPKTETRLIKPCGFVVEQSATAKHRITQEHADENGACLLGALKDLLADATKLHADGGCLCSHHLGFDAGLLDNEMHHLELHDMAASWAQIVRDGMCTMDPDVGHWVRKMIGIGDKPRNIPMRLMDLVKTLLPDRSDLLANHHDAGTDSYMHWLVASELMARARV